VYVSYSSPPFDPLSTIKNELQAGYNNGGWNGIPSASTGVILSSAARVNTGYMIGYADSTDGVVAGQPANTIELKYTLGGDLDLTGTVNFNDFARLVANYGKPADWDGGALSYGATVSFADFALLVSNYGKQAIATTFTAAAVNASESLKPASHTASHKLARSGPVVHL
jgi:hypothetical protein